MEKIFFEKEVCEYLGLPSIPCKQWDGKTPFKDGVAVVRLSTGETAYAVCTFMAERDKEPRIRKSFAPSTFVDVEKILVVPPYMDTKDIEGADLDEQSKEAAKQLAAEAEDLTRGGEEDGIVLPKNEYYFDNIHNDDEAIAFITTYNRDNNIRGNVPTKHETIVMRLGVIHSELKKKKKNR